MDVKSSNFQFVQIFFIFNPRHLKKGQTLESLPFYGLYFYERDGRTNFKFNIALEVHFIYRLIPRKLDFLGRLPIFDTTPIGRFWGLFVTFTTAYNIKVLLSVYHSIDMRCIVLPEKFDGRLSISVLRRERSFFGLFEQGNHFCQLTSEHVIQKLIYLFQEMS
jgi:hypothetical protein